MSSLSERGGVLIFPVAVGTAGPDDDQFAAWVLSEETNRLRSMVFSPLLHKTVEEALSAAGFRIESALARTAVLRTQAARISLDRGLSRQPEPGVEIVDLELLKDGMWRASWREWERHEACMPYGDSPSEVLRRLGRERVVEEALAGWRLKQKRFARSKPTSARRTKRR